MAYNHFDYVPSSVTDDRSGFKFQKAVAKAGQLGWLYPICKPVPMLPGSSLTLDIAMEVRSQPLIAPLMDELHLDIFAFNVPNRIVWEHWKQFLGATDDVLFDNLTEYQIPNFKYGSGINRIPENMTDVVDGELNYYWNQLLACHFELPFPLKTTDGDWSENEFVRISALPFRGYNFIYNEFFTPEYLDFRILFSKTDEGHSGDNMNSSTKDGIFDRFENVITPAPDQIAFDGAVSAGGVVLPVYRAHRSLWTSCLPKPSLETLNLLGTVNNVPVGTIVENSFSSNVAYSQGLTLPNSGDAGEFVQSAYLSSTLASGKMPIIAKINEAILTVNNYRETILLQNYYDALNRAGSRYDEILANLFHTRTSMAIIDIPELIVHKRFTIYRKDVIATAQTNTGSVQQATNGKPLGSQGGYIDTVIRDSFFTKSTTEHGYIHMLMCVRPAFIRMTSGFEPDWTVLNKLDLFYPQFQGMGDVPRKKMEVTYGFTSEDSKDVILGYQEYSAEYKYQRNSAVGWLDSHTPNPLKGYNITDEFAHTSNVSLDTYWLSCASEEVSFANCLAIPSPIISPQFIFDIRLNGTIYHPMKVYNIPGQGDLL